MVNTFLTKDDQALKLEFEHFATHKLAPIAAELGSGKTSPNIFLKQLAQAGYLGLNVPIAYGGKDAPFLHLTLLAEALANYEAGVVLYIAYHAAVIELIKAYGSDQQKSIYLPKLAQGELLGTLAYLELPKESTSKNGDSQPVLKQDISPQNILNTKVLVQGENLILSGQKELTVLSTLPANNSDKSNNVLSNLVLVLTDSSFIILDNLSAPTIKIKKQKMFMGLTSLLLASLSFENHPLKRNACLGEDTTQAEKTSVSSAEEKLIFARGIIKTLLAATALGMSERALNETTAHAKIGERGGTPLAQSEAIQWKLADAAADTSAARLLTYRAAWSKDEDRDKFLQYATMAKAYATRIARIHTGEALQIILPFLQNIDSPLTCFYMDSKILETFDATNEEEKVLLSKLLGI